MKTPMLSSPADPRKPGSGAARLRRSVSWLLLAVFVCAVLFRGINLWWRYEEVLAGGREQAEKFAHVLSEHLHQTVATIDATFGRLAAHGRHAGGPQAPAEEWTPVLHAALSGLKAVHRLVVLDREGVIRHSTQPQLVGESRRDHPLFASLAAEPRPGPSAHALLRDAATGRLMLPVGRALAAADGDFDGIVAALIDPMLLAEFYRSIDLGPGSAVAIFTREGEPVLRHGADVRDGLRYITAMHGVDGAPLVIAVSLAEDDVLRPLRNELEFTVVSLGVVALLLLLLGGIMARVAGEHAAADAALRRHQARFFEIMQRAPMLVSLKDTRGRLQFVNKALEELLDAPLADVQGKRLRDIASIMTDPADLIDALDQEVIATKTPLQRELTYASQDGARTVLFVKFPLLDAKGDVEAIASFSTDLTEQRRAANWFRTIMDHAPPLIALKDTSGRFLFVNRAQERASGLKAAEFLGRRSGDLFPPEYAALHDEFDRAVIAARAPVQRQFTAPYNAGQRVLLFVKFPVFDAKGDVEAVGSIATDITAQQQAESQLAHAQRMEAVGQLTGGIAHDFNNLLTVIIGNAELLATELAGNERLAPLARLTLDAAERSAALTQRLLAFGRQQLLESRPTDVKRLLDGMEILIERAAGPGVSVTVGCSEAELWPALVDPGQLETAVLNLVVNSRDAMPHGGRIVIETANVTLDEGYADANPEASPGDYLMLAVSDTGSGMAPEVAARVFEPFFTTKEVGKGTGLGLPTIYGFIRQSGGHVKIYSELGHGTTVRLYIPRADAPGLVPALPGNEGLLPRGRESILLVEDDRIVRTYTEGQLVELGYRVTTAGNPEEALKIAVLTGRPDLLITDVVMPGKMNGRELAERMRLRWPGLAVICMSGYADGILPELENGMAGGLHFLSKPFHRRDLALKVREALDAAARETTPA